MASLSFPLGLGFALVVTGCAGNAEASRLSLRDGGAARPLHPDVVAARGAQSVGVIRTDAGTGLGFVIDSAGYLLTNRHVIEDAEHVEEVSFPALDPPRSFSGAHVVYVDPQRDLAILKVHTVTPLPALKVSRPFGSRAPGSRDQVLVLRREPGDDTAAHAAFAPERGVITRLDVTNDLAGPGVFMGLTARVQRGQSGGPVLDRYGRAIGVVTWTWRHVDGGYAIPIGDAREMLAKRPALRDYHSRTQRARARADEFLGAIGSGRYQAARQMTSPSWAKQLRESTLSEILDRVVDSGSEVLHSFVGALDRVSTDSEIRTEERRMQLLEDMVSRTGTPEFSRAVGLHGHVDPELVVSFFYEFGHAYVAARRFGGKSSAESVEAGLLQLSTMEAARTFAMAELSSVLDGRSFDVTGVEVHPSEYRPTATVRLSGPDVAEGTRDTLLLVLRLEWGDWYVADARVSATG